MLICLMMVMLPHNHIISQEIAGEEMRLESLMKQNLVTSQSLCFFNHVDFIKQKWWGFFLTSRYF